MTDTERCVARLHWLIDHNSHINQVVGIHQDGDDIVVDLSDAGKIKITSYTSISDLLEQICQGIDDADNWRR